MHKFSLALSIALSFIMPQFAVALPAQRQAPAVQSSVPQPSIEFLRPQSDETFFNLPIFIHVQVTNFNLVPIGFHSPPRTSAGGNHLLSGHIDYKLDDFPILAADEPQVMIGKNLGLGFIPVGRHLLQAQLMDENDHPLKPPVTAVTVIWSGHPAARELVPTQTIGQPADLADAELQRVQHHLDEVRKELRRIQNGSSGYQPDPQFKNNGQTSE